MNKRFILASAFVLAIIVFIFSIPIGVFAQSSSQRNPCYNTAAANPNCVSVGTTTPLPVTQSGVASNSYTPLSPTQTALGIVASTALTVPSTSTYAVVCVEGANARYTTDGVTTPTASVGMPLLQNQCVSLAGSTTISNFRAIQQAATATLDVSYFK